MPLTPDSMRTDPRRRVFVEALTGFYIGDGRGVAEEGDVVEVPWSTAVTLFQSRKAMQVDGPARKALPKPDPNLVPHAQSAKGKEKAL